MVFRGGGDPREQELGEADPDRDVHHSGSDVERELASACCEALAEIGRRSVPPHAGEYDERAPSDGGPTLAP